MGWQFRKLVLELPEYLKPGGIDATPASIHHQQPENRKLHFGSANHRAEKVMTGLLVALLLWSGEAVVEVRRLKLSPLDFQDMAHPDTLIPGIAYIASDGDSLYIASPMDPAPLQISREGRFIRRIGGDMSWGALGRFGVQALSVQKERIWLLDKKGKAHYFEGGEHLLSWEIQFHYPGDATPASGMAFDQDQVVIPVHPASQHLAGVYAYSGALINYLGDISAEEKERASQEPTAFAIHWARDKNHWYGLYKHRPKLMVFDNGFQLVKEADVRVMGEPFLIKDFKRYGGRLYLLCGDGLYQLDAVSLKTTARFQFDPPFESGKGGAGDFFALLHPEQAGKNPVLVMGWQEMPGDHDLWQAELPSEP